MRAKQVVELSIRDFTQSEHLDSRHSFQTVWASVYPLISSTCSVRTEHEILDKYYWYCSNELFITLDSRCLLLSPFLTKYERIFHWRSMLNKLLDASWFSGKWFSIDAWNWSPQCGFECKIVWNMIILSLYGYLVFITWQCCLEGKGAQH